jgi:hypothetical protein
MFAPLHFGLSAVQGEELGAQLGEVPFYGEARHCTGACHLSSGIKVDKVKVDLVFNLPPPHTVKEVHSFWAMQDSTCDLSRISTRSPSLYASYW